MDQRGNSDGAIDYLVIQITQPIGNIFGDENFKWSQSGCIRALLGLGVYDYYRLEFADYTNPWSKVIKKWRVKLMSSQC